jgi:pyochelin biosynthesis protein PchC
MTAALTLGERWIRRYREARPGAPKLICLPHAGGVASFFRPVAHALAPHCEIWAVQYPGRQDRLSHRLLDRVEDIADQLFSVLRRHTHEPVALFGHSLGATVAFELARRFESAGTVPIALLVSARSAPSRHRDGRVHLGTDDELIALLRALDGTAEQVLGQEELLRLTLPVIRGDYKAAETYRYPGGPKLSCPVHAFIGRDDPMVTEDEARAWGNHTTARFTLNTFGGGHFFLVDHQAAVFLSTIKQLLGV